jgi:DNA-binding HxlR family transcriptional regulator
MATWTYVGRSYRCPIALTAGLLAGRWRTNVLWLVWKGTNRFNAIARALPDVNRGVLLRVLRALEADGLVQRLEHGARPAPVEYALTERARSLAPLLAQMAAWGRAQGERRRSSEALQPAPDRRGPARPLVAGPR